MRRGIGGFEVESEEVTVALGRCCRWIESRMGAKMNDKNVRSLLSDAQLEEIKTSACGLTGAFPTWYPIFSQNSSPTDNLSNQAVRLVSDKGDHGWLSSLTPRLCNLRNPEDAAAALAELRVYGAFLEAAFDVKPIPVTSKSTPDFEIDAGDGPVIVEVFAKHQAVQAGGAAKKIIHKANSGQIQTTVSVHQPGGAPDPRKEGDSVQANVISRVCAAKGAEKQFPEDKPSLLWMDFRTFGAWPDVVSLDQCMPLMSGREGITSGALWYAFFGWKGAPIFEEDFPLCERIVHMGHDGRFLLQGKKKSKLSGVILALSKGCVLFENPSANVPLPERARRYIERLPWFHIGNSIINWSAGDAGSLMNTGRNQIQCMYEWHEKFNAD